MTHDVAIIGLGAMGSALARVQISAGYETVVWNRTRSKALSLEKDGAEIAETGSDAVGAAEVVLVCVDTEANAVTALEGCWGDTQLDGRVVVQLGTTTPDEARRFAAKVTAAGGRALDGAIMCYPSDLGPENTATVMVGGDPVGFKTAEPMLRQISGNLIDLGNKIAAAAALDLGLLTSGLSLYAGIAHAALLCEAEGADVELMSKLFIHGPIAPKRLEIIAKDAFELNSLHDGGSLQVWADVAENVRKHAQSAGINSELPNFLSGLYRRAVEAGHGPEDVAALIKMLRGG